MRRKDRRADGRGRDPWKAAFFGLTAAALIAGVAWALLGSSLLVVRSVQVSGSGQVPKATVLAAAAVRIGTPLVRVDVSAVARRVERITLVQSARVSRSWPDTIVISIRPRTAVLAVRAGGGYDLIDAYGVVLSRTAKRPDGMPVLLSPAGPATGLRGNPAVYAAGTVVRALPGRLRNLVSAVRAAGPGRVTLLLRGGMTVVWGGTGRAAAKASELAILLRTRAQYYDVSDPGTAVTRR
jgi:cell division protein FtsQ